MTEQTIFICQGCNEKLNKEVDAYYTYFICNNCYEHNPSVKIVLSNEEKEKLIIREGGMKEQVSVDEQKLIDELVKSAIEGNPKYCFVTIEEYKRLKRLDANVQKLIAELKLVDGETTPSSLGKLLQGLYK
jgi:hypothetical protein